MAKAFRFLCIHFMVTVAFGLGVVPSSLSAQDGVKKPRIHAVFRISKSFLHESIDQKLIAEIPLSAKVMGFCCTGTIHGEGNISVDLQSSGDQAVFSVDSAGDGRVCVKGQRGPLVAYGSAWGPFSSRTLVQFDGRQFQHLQTVPRVTVHAQLRRVTGHRDRPIGRLIGAGARPIAKNMVPKAIPEATRVASGYLSQYVEELADGIISKLNQKTPIEKTANRLFPKTSNWQFQMSGGDNFLQAAYGPSSAMVPELPLVPIEMEEVRMEAWLLSTGAEAQLLASASQRPLAKQLIQTYFENSLPELAAIAQERTIHSVGPWVLIRIGKGKTPTIDVQKLGGQ